MASTYSANLGLDLMATGDQPGNWGVINNTNLGDLLEQAVSGYVTQAVTDGADTTLVITPGNGSLSGNNTARNMTLELTGTLTATRNVIIPNNRKLYFVYNNTSGGFAVTVKVSGQTGVSVPNGAKMLLVCNGVDAVQAVTYINNTLIPSSTTLATTSTAQTITNKTISALNNTITDITLSSVSGTLGVANGGTGATTLTGYVYGNGTGAFTASTTIPAANVSGNISGNAANVTGTVAIANGGTGQTTAANAINALLPTQTGNSGKYLTTNGSVASWATVSGGGGGTVTSVSMTVPAFLTVTGSPVTASGTLAVAYSGTALPVANGGTGATTLSGYLYGNGVGAFTASTTIPSGNITGLAASATVDATNASNIGTGTLPTARLTGSYTGITGVGTLSAGSIPVGLVTGLAASATTDTTNASNLTSGTVPSARVSGAYSGITGIGTLVTGAVPSGLVTGLATSATTDATNASNITSGTLGTARLGTGTANSTTYLRGDQTWATIASGGTVTSVSGTGTVNGLTLTGTVTNSGSLTLGGTLSNVSLTSAVTGTLPLANGGTGSTTAQAAINNLVTSVTSGFYLRGNGSNVIMSAIQAADVPTLNQNTTGQAGSIANQGNLATLNANQAETRNISNKNGVTKTLSTSAATGGSDGDIWYQY